MNVLPWNLLFISVCLYGILLLCLVGEILLTFVNRVPLLLLLLSSLVIQNLEIDKSLKLTESYPA
jgi:hypothetical protein